MLTRLYSATPDGYCGDEDNGQTSAWYVFSSLGFYPVTPGINEYVIGSPLFKKATLTLENGNTFNISALNNSKDNVFIDSVLLNGKIWNNSFINFEDIQAGGFLEFDMNTTPNKKWADGFENTPYSLSKIK